MAGPVSIHRSGFTLLEALIALSIAALILTGVYRLVQSGTARMRILEERAETLHLWSHARRVIRHDLEMLEKEPPARLVREGNNALVLRCSGALVPDWRLGAKVEVIYRWRAKEREKGMIWERLIQRLGEDREKALVTLRIEQNLESVEYDLLDAQEWRLFGEGAQSPWRAIRWRFNWRDIGPWHVILNLTPLPEIHP
ncbi:MAG: prepilin-type N-terminal cleavage/methylation domain-containing protein [Magnetococcus sp. YQC-9]